MGATDLNLPEGEIADADLALLDTLIDDPSAIASSLYANPAEAVRLMCILQAVVSRSGVTDFPSSAADCICGDGGPLGRGDTDGFRNDGQSLAYIARATVAAIAAEQVA